MPPERRVVAVTGATGFIGRNLVLRLAALGYSVRSLERATPPADAAAALEAADAVFHLAAAVRPQDAQDFARADDYSAWVVERLRSADRRPLVIYASSTRADEDTAYARGKRTAETLLFDLAQADHATAVIYRLPNVFGKWARPNYNSAVATFCHNLSRGLPIVVNDRGAALSLLHVDDLIDQWMALLSGPAPESGVLEATCVHQTTVGKVADLLEAFAAHRGPVPEARGGLERALYATFVSARPQERLSHRHRPEGVAMRL